MEHNHEKQIIKTADGSNTIFIPSLNETYHSKFGALQESEHVFVGLGFRSQLLKELNILEIGFGTGLNAILTLAEAIKRKIKVHYCTFELYPLDREFVKSLDYQTLFDNSLAGYFQRMHEAPWNKTTLLHPLFRLEKMNADAISFAFPQNINVIYLDAFAPDVQPELWTQEMMHKYYQCLNAQGVLVTYSTKGIVKSRLTEAGFSIQKMNGPAGGKREVLRAVK